MENQFQGRLAHAGQPKTVPDFARQRRELLQSIELTLVERIAGRGMEAQLERMFSRETATWLRCPGGFVAGRAGGIVTVIAAMSSAAVADVTGYRRGVRLVAGTLVAFRAPGEKNPDRISPANGIKNAKELVAAIEQQLRHAIDLFYAEIGRGFFQPLRAFSARRSEKAL